MNSIQMTEKSLARVAAEWSQIAGETVMLEVVAGTLYAFGTELGMLRLEHKFNAPHAKARYMGGVKSWGFRLENATFSMAA